MNKRYKATVALGIFFGAGFLCGFLSGYRYAAANLVCEVPRAAQNFKGASSGDFSGSSDERVSAVSEDAPIDAASDIGLVLEDYWMDSDDNGLFIAGAVKNADASAFDSVMVAFDLLDDHEQAYSAVTRRNNERMEPGDSWDFTIYIPYSEMDKFKSYRLQSVMGVKR
jgi:hypothetical protein